MFSQRLLPPSILAVPDTSKELLEHFLKRETLKQPEFPANQVLDQWMTIVQMVGLDVEWFIENSAAKIDSLPEELRLFYEQLSETVTSTLSGKSGFDKVKHLAGKAVMHRFLDYLAQVSKNYKECCKYSTPVFNVNDVIDAIATYKFVSRKEAYEIMVEIFCTKDGDKLKWNSTLDLQPKGLFTRCPSCNNALSIPPHRDEPTKPDIGNLIYHCSKFHIGSDLQNSPRQAKRQRVQPESASTNTPQPPVPSLLSPTSLPVRDNEPDPCDRFLDLEDSEQPPPGPQQCL